jgi:predicted transcriptional regulator
LMEAYSVRFDDSLPARLERLISAAERRVEVINLGVGGM